MSKPLTKSQLKSVNASLKRQIKHEEEMFKLLQLREELLTKRNKLSCDVYEFQQLANQTPPK